MKKSFKKGLQDFCKHVLPMPQQHEIKGGDDIVVEDINEV